ncbi:MAG: ribonuclease H-like domain-containing protein [candidate division Zixibacteria bacterium]|nr:ribonuclease H-like domain-containing protein [candidate division Zixibacteria bacterium]
MLRDKLNRLSGHIVGPESGADDEYRDRYHIAAECLRGEICARDEGTFVKIVTDFDPVYRHGEIALGDLDRTVPYRSGHFMSEMAETVYDPGNLLFFDMETTGLGGSGTVAFLIGFGSVTPEGFQVRQYFLPDYPDEAAMLETLRSEIDEKTIIVSYNGKTFDMPILRDRMIINRVERNLTFADHVDLLHSTRRLFRRRIGSCSLGNIEREVLGFHRVDDLPGELVPPVYFNWLATSDTELLNKVVEHNLYDIVSLYFLLHHLSVLMENPSVEMREADDMLSLVRVMEKRREHGAIPRLLEQCEPALWDERRFDVLMHLALAYKRTGQIDRAVLIWRKITATTASETFFARIELAKYFEHRRRDIASALAHTMAAEPICPSILSFETDLERRLRRLRKKQGSPESPV